MNRFNRFAALRWVYNMIVPPRYRDKLNFAEELIALEKALNNVIEVTNNNGLALDAISKDLNDIQFGPGGFYLPAIKDNGDGSITFSFTPSDVSLTPIEDKTFFIGDMKTVSDMLSGIDKNPQAVKEYIDKMSGGFYTPSFEQNGHTVTVSFRGSNDALPPIAPLVLTLTVMTTDDREIIVNDVLQALPKYNGEVITL